METGFPTVWQHCQLISLDNILPITTIHKSVLFFIPRWSCNVPSNVGTTSCDLWESLGRGAYSQAYAGLLCDTRASQHHVWGFSPKLEILPNRETGWVEHSWNFFYFLIKRNKSHWNFLNINLSCQRIYLNIEWNLTISVKKPSTLIDLYYHHLHINHKNSMKKKNQVLFITFLFALWILWVNCNQSTTCLVVVVGCWHCPVFMFHSKNSISVWVKFSW